MCEQGNRHSAYDRIAVDGAQGTGKTTLINALASILPDVPIIREGARELAPMFGVHTTEDWSMLYDNEVFGRLFVESLLARQEVEESRTKFVTDGTIYRIYAYAQADGMTLHDGPLERAAYDLVAYCPIEFASPMDGFRILRSREIVDAQLRLLIESHHRGVVVECHGSLEERISRVRSVLMNRACR